MSKKEKVIIKKPKLVNVSPEDIKLFDQANKRIRRLELHNEQSGDSLKKTDIASFRNSARAITGTKRGNLSKAKKMTKEKLKAQRALAKKITEDKTMTVKGAQTEEDLNRQKWVDNIKQAYPELHKNEIKAIYNELVKYNREHYEESPFQQIYETWSDNYRTEKDRGLIQVLLAGKKNGVKVKDSLKWLESHASYEQSWSGLANQYLSQW